jgi:hypothetical protein
MYVEPAAGRIQYKEMAMAGKNIIDERIEEMWARTQKWLEAGTFDQHMPESLAGFSRDILPPLATKLFFKGVGQLDERSAGTVLREVGCGCGDFELGLMALKGVNMPLKDIDKEIDYFLRVHEMGENVASGGRSSITRKGNTATLVIQGGCACPLVKLLDIEPTPNHCFCTQHHLKHVYEAVLGRPVKVDLLETCLRGGDSCTIDISW